MATQVGNADRRPVEIRRFEQLQFAAIAAELIAQFVLARGSLIIYPLSWTQGGSLIGSMLAAALTLAVSRGRQGWVRFFLAALLVLSIPADLGLLAMATVGARAVLYVPALILRGAALAFAFSRSSAEWLVTSPNRAVHARNMRRLAVVLAILIVALPLLPWIIIDFACVLFGPNYCL